MCRSFIIFIAVFATQLLLNVVNAESREAEIGQLLEQAERARLYDHPTWLRLLEYAGDGVAGSRSEIVTPEFFNAENGNVSPAAELHATLRAFFDVAGDDPDQHPLCKFPARYYWLNSILDFPHHLLPVVSCGRLNDWAKFDKLESISLIMVSGYFGNPASTFGHILIKLNNGGGTESEDLLDQGINYGAVIPQNEPTAIYILKGLFGGYVGGFSDKKFYTQDLVYSATQFRDMWEYELDLNADQQRMFIYHMWELVGKKYVYYFLKENCGYRVARLMELTTGKQLIREPQPWFLPVHLFYAIQDIDAQVEPNIIKSIRFRPSSERSLQRAFTQLDAAESQAAIRLIENPRIPDMDELGSLSTGRRAHVIDVALMYHNYRIAGHEDEDLRMAEMALDKQALLTHRLQLPVSEKEPGSDFEDPKSPASGSRSGMWRVSAGGHSAFGTMLKLGASVIHYDSVSNVGGSLDNSEIRVMDTVIGFTEEEGVFLDYLDLLSIQKIDADTTAIPGETNLSWRVSTGIRRVDLSCTDCLTAYLEGGPGRAFRLGRRVIAYGMLAGHLQSEQDHAALEPNAGFIFSGGERWKANVEVGQRFSQRHRDGRTNFHIQSRYSLSGGNEVRIAFDRFRDSEYLVSYYRYW